MLFATSFLFRPSLLFILRKFLGQACAPFRHFLLPDSSPASSATSPSKRGGRYIILGSGKAGYTLLNHTLLNHTLLNQLQESAKPDSAKPESDKT